MRRWRAIGLGLLICLGLWSQLALAQPNGRLLPDLNPPPATPSAVSPPIFPDDPGSDVVVGGIPVFRLQTADYSSDVRAQAVEAVISEFLREGMADALPEVRVELDNNRQYTLALGQRGNFEATRRYLFTVTYADTAAARGLADPKLADVQLVALRWAGDLEQAIARYRQDRLDAVRGQRPLVLTFSVLSALAVLLLAYLSWWLGLRALARGQSWLEHRLDQSWHHWVDLGMLLCRLVLGVVAAGLGGHLSLGLVPLLRGFQRQFYHKLGRILGTAFGVLVQPLPNSSLSIASVGIFVMLAVAVFIASGWVSRALKQRFLIRTGLDEGTQEAAAAIFKNLLTLLGILLVLPFSGLNLGSLAVIAGALSLGIGFGLQNLTANYLSYMTILFERPIQIGDFVEVDDLLGSVERIGPRATVLRTLDRVFVIVPNSRFIEAKVVNWSYRDPRCRIHIPVGVAYGTDPDLVSEALLQVALANGRVLSTPAPQVWLRNFGPYSLNFDLLVWINRPQEQFLLISEINFQIEAEFRRRNIAIPYPQQDVHVHSAGPLQQWFLANGTPDLKAPETDGSPTSGG